MTTFRNSVCLVGRLGKSVDLKSLESGTTLARVSLATNDYYKNAKGESIKNTQWHNLIAWGHIAEKMQNKLSKGSEVLINGKLLHRSYEDSSGQIRYTTEIKVLDFMEMQKVQKEALPF